VYFKKSMKKEYSLSWQFFF